MGRIVVDRKNLCAIGGVGLVLLLDPTSGASGRETILSGNVSMQQEYDSNIYQEESDRQEQWTTIFMPTLTLVSSGEKDTLLLAASSDLSWDQRLDDRDFSHSLLVSADRELSPHLKITLSDNYSYNDNAPQRDMDAGLSISRRFQRADAYEQAEVARLLFPSLAYDPSRHYLMVLSEIERRYAQASPSVQGQVDLYLSNSDGRRRYWDNEVAVGAEYEYAKDSIIGLGYRYFINDNRTPWDYANNNNTDEDGGGYEDYFEHSPYVSLSYRFNPQWRASVNYQFTKGQHETASDLKEHDTLFALDYTLSQQDQLIGTYGYTTSNFVGDQEDLVEQTGSLGWNHEFTPQLRLATSVDGSYLTREYYEDEREIGLDVGLTRLLQRGSISIGTGVTTADAKTDGSWEDLRESWSVDGAMTYALLEDLTGTINASYEKRDSWQDIAGKTTFDDYEAGVALTYSFMRWFALSCRYSYSMLESDSDLISDYHEHLIVVELSAAKELMRW